MSEEAVNQEEKIKSLMARVDALEENAPNDNLCLGVMDGDYDKTMAAFTGQLPALLSRLLLPAMLKIPVDSGRFHYDD